MAVASVAVITAPITWDLQQKFRIQDLRDTHHVEVIKLIKHHYLLSEPMCKSVQLLKDALSTQTYLNLIKSSFKDTCSIVAISEKSGRVIGTAICRISSQNDRTDVYNQVQEYDGETIGSIMQFINTLVRESKIYETLGHDTYLRIYVLCVHPSYKNKGVARALIESCCLLASNMEIPVIAGIFTSNENQMIAEHVGFSLLKEIAYNNWLVDGEVVFDDPGVGNYSAAMMFIPTPDEETLKHNKKIREKEEKLQLHKRLQQRKKK